VVIDRPIVAAVAADLTSRYEALRRAVIEGGLSAPGVGVVLRAGLSAWMDVCVATPPPDVPRPTPQSGSASDRDRFHSELIHIWAQMALGLQQEEMRWTSAAPSPRR
jgi:hypothetical protein